MRHEIGWGIAAAARVSPTTVMSSNAKLLVPSRMPSIFRIRDRLRRIICGSTCYFKNYSGYDLRTVHFEAA